MTYWGVMTNLPSAHIWITTVWLVGSLESGVAETLLAFIQADPKVNYHAACSMIAP
jgi:hypothetical protein